MLVPNSDITIKNVGVNPTRTGILDIFKQMGGNIEITNERIISNEKVADIRVTSSSLTGLTIEGDIIPRLLDEVPIITVAATMAQGTTIIKDLNGYKVKESGRIKLIIGELLKMGAHIKETDDGLIIEGGTPINVNVNCRTCR